MSPSANNNFYLTNLRESWWQAEGAGVYAGSMAGGVTVRSEIPTALTKLILPGSGGTSAALLRASGQADLGAGEVSLSRNLGVGNNTMPVETSVYKIVF